MDEHPFLSGPLTHAGGIVYRVRERVVDVLLIRAKPSPHDWVFPKGHIEEGETGEECARREVREEAGVDAIVEDRLGEDRYITAQGKCVRAVFFLMRWSAEVPAAGERETRWFALDDLLERMPFDGAQRLLQAARRMLTQDGPAEAGTSTAAIKGGSGKSGKSGRSGTRGRQDYRCRVPGGQDCRCGMSDRQDCRCGVPASAGTRSLTTVCPCLST